MNRDMYEAALAAQRFSLIARLNAAKGYLTNTYLAVERTLLRNQISAIEEEISRVNKLGNVMHHELPESEEK